MHIDLSYVRVCSVTCLVVFMLTRLGRVWWVTRLTFCFCCVKSSLNKRLCNVCRHICFDFSLDVHAKDLIEMPKKPPVEKTRRPAKKVPSWHLTSPVTMKYIEGVDARKKAEKEKQDKYDAAKKEAVAKVKQEERKTRSKSGKVTRVVTHLFKPAAKPKNVKRVK